MKILQNKLIEYSKIVNEIKILFKFLKENSKYIKAICWNRDLSSFNKSNAGYMDYMFHSCSSLFSINLPSFNASNVSDMRGMFKNCSSLNSINLSSSFTTNYTKINGIFGSCKNLCKNNIKCNDNKILNSI